MEIAPGVEVVPLSITIWGHAMTIHPVVLYDEEGATAVDTGMPGHEEAFLEVLDRVGVGRGKLRRIVLTHQDYDHIGAARALKERTGAETLAHADDAPYIRGERKLIKFAPERAAARLAQLEPAARAAMERLLADLPSVPVDRTLVGGEELPIHGGVVVVHTPGHTPGHISLYLRRHRLLITGDALRVEEGALLGPNPANTLDVPEANRALRRLLPYDIDYALCYHGGLFGPGAGARIRELAEAAP